MHRATAHTRRARPQALASIARALGPAGRGAQLPPSGHARPAGSRSVAGRGVAASVHPLQGPSAGQTLLGLQLLRGQLRPLLLHQHAGRGLGRGGAGRPAGALPALPGLLVVVAVVVQPDAVLLQGQQVVLFGLDGEAYGSERRCWEKGDGDRFQGAEPPPLDPTHGEAPPGQCVQEAVLCARHSGVCTRCEPTTRRSQKPQVAFSQSTAPVLRLPDARLVLGPTAAPDTCETSAGCAPPRHAATWPVCHLWTSLARRPGASAPGRSPVSGTPTQRDTRFIGGSSFPPGAPPAARGSHHAGL